MASKYDKIDEEFANEVLNLLTDRTFININDNAGVSYSLGNEIQRIYPEATISYEDIRSSTNRKSIRQSVIDKYANYIEKKGFDVEKTDHGLKVIVPENKEDNVTSFSSIDSLRKANQKRRVEYNKSRDDFDNDEDFEESNPFINPF